MTLYSEKFSEFFHGKPRVLGDSSHGKGIDRIISWDNNKAGAIGENNMPALTNDFKASLFQRTNGLTVLNAWKFRHESNGYFDFPNIRAFE